MRSDEEVGRTPSRDIVEETTRKVELASSGLPVGVQVVARPWLEHVALAAMRSIEEVVRARSDYSTIAMM